MEHIETRYEVTLRDKEGNEFKKVKAFFNGTFLLGKELWALFVKENNRCYTKFYDKGRDDELYPIGYCKVVKMERVDTYEERTIEIL